LANQAIMQESILANQAIMQESIVD